MASYSFTVDPVVQGASFKVEVTDAPCTDVTVEFRLDGVLVGSNTVTVVGSATFSCPSSSDGREWTIVVKCPGESGVDKTGTVQAN